ncbi:hypothetical protein AgCh_015796 [Apium graveolens]
MSLLVVTVVIGCDRGGLESYNLTGQAYGKSRGKRGEILLSFFKPIGPSSTTTNEVKSPSNIDIEENAARVEIEEIEIEEPSLKSRRVEIDINTLERDPGIRIPIWQHPVNQRDEIRRAYIKMGPYQPKLVEYPRTRYGSQTQYRRFQYS